MRITVELIEPQIDALIASLEMSERKWIGTDPVKTWFLPLAGYLKQLKEIAKVREEEG